MESAQLFFKYELINNEIVNGLLELIINFIGAQRQVCTDLFIVRFVWDFCEKICTWTLHETLNNFKFAEVSNQRELSFNLIFKLMASDE